MNEMKSWSGKQWLAFLIQFVIVLLVVFGKWLGYSLNYLFGTTSDSTTLLGVGKLLSNLGNIIGDEADGLIALAVLIYVLLAVGVWMCVKPSFPFSDLRRSSRMAFYTASVSLSLCCCLC